MEEENGGGRREENGGGRRRVHRITLGKSVDATRDQEDDE